jgi:hypothetical protein
LNIFASSTYKWQDLLPVTVPARREEEGISLSVQYKHVYNAVGLTLQLTKSLEAAHYA